MKAKRENFFFLHKHKAGVLKVNIASSMQTLGIKDKFQNE
jgi:hypothetical protein